MYLLLCCYLDANLDYTLSGLALSLEVMKILQKKRHRFTYRLAILPGTIGYAAYLTKISQVQITGALHLMKMDAYSNPIMQRSSIGDKQLETSVCKLMAQQNNACVPAKLLFDPLSTGNNPVAKNRNCVPNFQS